MSVIHRSRVRTEPILKLIRGRWSEAQPYRPFKNIWDNLIGRIITCPVCSGEAIILSHGMNLPHNIRPCDMPCHCSIGLTYGTILTHWCNSDYKYNKYTRDFSYVPHIDCMNYYSEIEKLTYPNMPFDVFIKNGYTI